VDSFYCPPEKISDGSVVIDGDEFNHLFHVMRKKEGDIIQVVDGAGTAYDVRLDDVARRSARGSVSAVHRGLNVAPFTLALAVGILKNPSRFDFLVEKATELGARAIIPLITRRTIPSHAKVDRWRKLALAAMKQCGRSVLPAVTDVIRLEELPDEPGTVTLLAHEAAAHGETLPSLVAGRPKAVTIIIGPEGGFDDEEIERCAARGYRTFSLGERRLRTETAAIVAAALAVSSWGE
jgi:16S rRNA (uracil1498-N3)-methyltransferase